jgi:adenine-specific DNA glycosylase
VVIHHRKKILLMRREQRDIWKGLYAPLVTELKSARMPSGKHIGSLVSKHIGVEKFEWLHSTSAVRQQLTHQTIIGRFHHIKLLDDPDTLPDHYAWVTKKTMNAYGKPRMVVEMIG